MQRQKRRVRRFGDEPERRDLSCGGMKTPGVNALALLWPRVGAGVDVPFRRRGLFRLSGSAERYGNDGEKGFHSKTPLYCRRATSDNLARPSIHETAPAIRQLHPWWFRAVRSRGPLR